MEFHLGKRAKNLRLRMWYVAKEGTTVVKSSVR